MAVADSIRETLIEAEHPMDPRDLIAIVADAYGHDETIEGLQVAIEHGRIALNGQGYVILVPTRP